MSTDNWAVCPRCTKNLTDKKRKLQQKLIDSYGKVSLEEYKKTALRLESYDYEIEDRNLREDYEIGVWEDKFFIKYSAHCQICGFTYKYGFEDANPAKENKNEQETCNVESLRNCR